MFFTASTVPVTRVSIRVSTTLATVKTAIESIDVHLGPTVWLREQGITLAAGDAVEIFGWRVTTGDVPILHAREIKKGDTTWTLHRAAGMEHCR